MDIRNNSNKLDITQLREVCAICLRDLAPRASHTPHICVNCERTAQLSNKLDKVFGAITRNNAATNQTLIRIAHIRNNGAFRIATCPLCGARSQVRGYANPSVSCPVCKVSISQFNGKVIANDTLIDRDLPYATDEWRPVFDRETLKDEKSNLLDKLEELNL